MDPRTNRPTPNAAPTAASSDSTRSATMNVLRTQIDSLYGDQPVASSTDSTPAAETAYAPTANPTVAAGHTTKDTINDSPYDRVHADRPQPQADQWKAYHTAWQNYYQKYYEAYYAYQNQQQEKQREDAIKQTLSQQLAATSNERAPGAEGAAENTNAFFSASAASPIAHTVPDSESFTKDRALAELRQKLRNTVQQRATKIRKSRHFIPIAAALSVVLVFLFLQYNSIIFGAAYAYIAPGAIDPQNIVVEPNADATVSADPRLIIPKINVDVPVSYDIGSDYTSQMNAMQNGLAHFAIPGANSHPGQVGNTVLSGHSSNDLFDKGDYKFIFAQLDKLEKGDTIYANYKSKRYTYVVTKKEVVKPTEVSKLVYQTSLPVMTLITCTPLGTSLNRLLVTAEQVSPDPAEATAASTDSGSSSPASTTIPGASSPTVIERLFGQK